MILVHDKFIALYINLRKEGIKNWNSGLLSSLNHYQTKIMLKPKYCGFELSESIPNYPRTTSDRFNFLDLT